MDKVVADLVLDIAPMRLGGSREIELAAAVDAAKPSRSAAAPAAETGIRARRAARPGGRRPTAARRSGDRRSHSRSHRPCGAQAAEADRQILDARHAVFLQRLVAESDEGGMALATRPKVFALSCAIPARNSPCRRRREGARGVRGEARREKGIDEPEGKQRDERGAGVSGRAPKRPAPEKRSPRDRPA